MNKKEEAEKLNSQWYHLRHILGNCNRATHIILLGGREAGKSYAGANFAVDQFVKKGIPYYWIRMTKAQADKVLRNNAEKLVDQDIRRRYNLDLKTEGENVYAVKRIRKQLKDGTFKDKIVEKKLMCRVMNLSTFYADKGALFDKDFLADKNMRFNVFIDEFQRESGERNTFDVAYALVNQLENILRSVKTRVKIFYFGNSLETSSDILCLFNFIPEEWGTYKLVKNKKKLLEYLKEYDNAKTDDQRLKIDFKYKDYDFGKRALIHYIPNTEEYNARRKHAISNVLMGNSSTFTNKIDVDKSLVTNKRLTTPQYVIKFTKDPKKWFTVWDGNIVTKWNGEKKPVYPMRPYLDEYYNIDMVKNIITMFDTRSYLFRHLITFKQFQAALELLKPRKG